MAVTEAAEQARQLLATIHSHGRLDFDCAQPDPRFDLDMLFTKGPGRMIGVLVAVDSQGSSHVLKAFSGQITETWHIPGWVGPVAGITNSSPLYYTRQYNPALPVTRAGQFVGMPAGAGDCCAPKLLHAAAAAGLTPTGLTEVWCGSAPGTATKAKMGRPITDNGLDPSSSRLHMQFYGMCDKCQALLGSMLCTASCSSSSTVSSSSSSSPNCSTVSCSMKEAAEV
ncbi:hypothetical protein OEZ86_004875 [Tetradesmus obliquus]|nr:hypothetical protein OEZ86_004875 [Tetradesmus obliquus]